MISDNERREVARQLRERAGYEMGCVFKELYGDCNSAVSGVTRCMRAYNRDICGFACVQVAPDGFCAWGEERED